jgi:hypothetical protein
VADTGSGGVTLVTDPEEPEEAIPEYFKGHWVEIRAADTTLKGTWRVESIDNLTATLEAGADVAEGDLWQGVYRFDSVTVTGKAKLRIDDLDDFGSVTVDPDSQLLLSNSGGPEVSMLQLSIDAHDGSYWFSGAPGAITDPSGVASAEVVNTVTASSWALAVAADGSFPAVAVAGAVGDLLRVDATDAHTVGPQSSSTEIGGLPANAAAPTVSAGLVQFTIDGAWVVHVVGSAGAVGDGNSPVLVTVTNTTGAEFWQTTAAPDGSFDVIVAGACGDGFTLTATDAHPAPLESVIDLAAMPDFVPPVVDATRIVTDVRNRSF